MVRQRLQLLFLAGSLVATLGLTGCSDDTDPEGTADSGIEQDAGEQDGATQDAGPQDADDGDVEPGDAGEPDGSDPDPTPDAGDVSPDAPSEPDADPDDDEDVDEGEDNDVCGDGDDADCDFDGLYDCEERQLGTDICEADTDGDGLTDMQELNHGTDPLVPDTDEDGLIDGDEIDLELDPTNPESYDDGVPDADRWMVSACDETEPETVDFYNSKLVELDDDSEVDVGNWRVALPTTFGNYTELDVAGADLTNRQAGAVYDDPSLEIAGYLLSDVADAGESDPSAVMDNHVNDIESVATVERDWIPSEFVTHDYRPARTGEFEVRTHTRRSAKDLRDELLFAMARYDREDTSGLPAESGATYQDFRVYVSTVYRELDGGEEQVVTSVAVAPDEKFESREKVRFRMDDLTNTTALTEAGDGIFQRCDISGPREAPPTDFYWVLDHSGSMNDENETVRDMANNFFNELNNTALDFRLGVTSMLPSQEGRLRSGAGWHSDLSTFINEVNWVIDDTGGSEPGLQNAQDGISYMKGMNGMTPPQDQRIRPDSNTIIIWMSDEEDQAFQFTSVNSATGQAQLIDYIDFFNDNNATGFAIVGNENCGDSDGQAYRIVAEETGGSHSSLCSIGMETTINEIIIAATSEVGYPLPDTPISSSLRVWINGEWVPRSRENGFDYFANNDTIAFFGSYRPEKPDGQEQPDTIAIHYETWLDRSKN